MNYSLEVKNELIDGAPGKACCKAAYAAGLFFDVRELRENCLVLVLSSLAARRECARVFREQYKSTALLDGTVMLFASKVLYENYQAPPKFCCKSCAGHFLRGLMISSASVTDPAKSYHLEFRLSNAERVEFLSNFFEERAWKMGCRPLSGGVGLYSKNSNVIEEILTVSGAQNAFFTFLNAKFQRSLRNEVNRTTNCVTRNIGRTVGAAARSCDAIRLLEEHSRLSTLSEELQETARLRIEFPNEPLSSLALRHEPPITKSGLNHRLQKIIDAAKALENT